VCLLWFQQTFCQSSAAYYPVSLGPFKECHFSLSWQFLVLTSPTMEGNGHIWQMLRACRRLSRIHPFIHSSIHPTSRLPSLINKENVTWQSNLIRHVSRVIQRIPVPFSHLKYLSLFFGNEKYPWSRQFLQTLADLFLVPFSSLLAMKVRVFACSQRCCCNSINNPFGRLPLECVKMTKDTAPAPINFQIYNYKVCAFQQQVQGHWFHVECQGSRLYDSWCGKALLEVPVRYGYVSIHFHRLLSA